VDESFPGKNPFRRGKLLFLFDNARRGLMLFMALLCLASASCNKSPETLDESKPISFGQRQVDQIVADRPDMAGILSNDDPVLQWIISGFNGDQLGQRIHWHARSPLSGSTAEHGAAYYGYPAYISVSGGTETTPIDKWASVVYELYNLENSADFEELSNQVMAGEIDGDGYALKCVELEFSAIEKTKSFFEKHNLPNSQHGNDPWYNWVSGEIGTFESYLESLQENDTGIGYHPLRYFKTYYDSTLLPYVDSQQEKTEEPEKTKEPQ
jgi:hypothetical protein